MTSNSIITPRATADIDEQAERIALDNPHAARRFHDATLAAIARLAEMPTLGAVCEFDLPAPSDMRMWPIVGYENHVIFYRPSGDGIVVLRMLHASRDFEEAFGS